MKIAFISPTSLIEDFHGDFHLALSHLIGGSFYKNKYVRTLLKVKKPILLDNGLFENGKPEGVKTLFKKARMLGAHTVFCPDTLYNRKKTEEAFKKIAKDHNTSDFQLGFVVQADNPKDYVEGYQWAVEQPEIALIGLSILAIPHSFKSVTGTDDIVTNRLECLRQLNMLPKHKKSHLLGAGSSYKDIEFAIKFCPWVVSHDSSSAVWNGIQRKMIDPISLEVEGGKSKIPVDFNFDEPLDNQQIRIIQRNIRTIKKLRKPEYEFTKEELKGIEI